MGKIYPVGQSPPVYVYAYILNYPTVEAKELFSERFQTQIKNYLRIRLIGVASVQVRSPTPALMRSSKITVLNVYKEVPDLWLKLSGGGRESRGLSGWRRLGHFDLWGKDINREVVDAR